MWHTDVIGYTDTQTGDGEDPEDEAQRLGHPQLDFGGGLAEVEGEDDGYRDDGHVDGEAEVGEEGCMQECCY